MMFGLLDYVIAGFAGWVLCDFFSVPKISPGKDPATSAQKVAKLYREIEKIKSQERPSRNFADDIRIKASSVFDIVKTISEMKFRVAFNALFSKKVGGHLLAIPYFHHDRWHYALVPSKQLSNNVLRITSSGNEVTDEVLKYMGPDENFYGQNVTPSMLGYNELVIHVMSSDGVVSKSFTAGESIAFSSS